MSLEEEEELFWRLGDQGKLLMISKALPPGHVAYATYSALEDWVWDPNPGHGIKERYTPPPRRDERGVFRFRIQERLPDPRKGAPPPVREEMVWREGEVGVGLERLRERRVRWLLEKWRRGWQSRRVEWKNRKLRRMASIWENG